MAEPVLVFQLPEMDLRLFKFTRMGFISAKLYSPRVHLHEGLVVLPDFLNVNVVFGVNERLSGAVGAGHGDDARHILEVGLRLHFELAEAAVSVAYFEYYRETG